MIYSFFIARPKFAIVIAIVIVIAGAVSLAVIPIAQYPNLAPPTVNVAATYPGADARVVEQTIAEPVEEQVNGAENALYYSSTSSSAGTYTLTVTFALGTDQDIDQVNVQNQVSLATAQLPATVTAEGLQVTKQSSNFVMAVNLYSPDNRYDQIFISNYTDINLRYPLARISGVGNATNLSDLRYSMRVWMNPVRMTALGITSQDVVSAIASQNIQAAAGQIGAAPISNDQQQQLTIVAQGRLTSVQQFKDIIIKTSPNQGVVRVADVADVQLGAQQYTAYSALNGSPSATLAIYQLPTANAIQISNAVEAQMKVLVQILPARPRLQDRLQLHQLRHRHHPRNPRHPLDHLRARRPRRVPVPAGLARHPHPHLRHPGLPHRRLRRALHPRLQRQHRLPLRHRAGHHPRRR